MIVFAILLDSISAGDAPPASPSTCTGAPQIGELPPLVGTKYEQRGPPRKSLFQLRSLSRAAEPNAGRPSVRDTLPRGAEDGRGIVEVAAERLDVGGKDRL